MEEKGSISTRRRQLWGVFFTSIFAFIYLSISLAEISFSAFLPVQCKIWVLLMDFKFTYSKIKIRTFIEIIIFVSTFFFSVMLGYHWEIASKLPVNIFFRIRDISNIVMVNYVHDDLRVIN